MQQPLLSRDDKIGESDPESVLSVRDLQCKIGNLTILKNIQFELKRGEILALLGPNGAGKSTLLKCLTGLLHCNGILNFAGAPLRKNPEFKRQIGYLAHETFLYQKLSGRENIRFYSQLYGLETDPDTILADFDLGRTGDQLVETYSRGMKQRLALARATLHRPNLLLLDEPFTGLDPSASELLYSKLLSLRSGAIIFSTHELERANKIAGSILILKNGRQAYYGTVSNISGDLHELYRQMVS
jgi:heme exporter protein A